MLSLIMITKNVQDTLESSLRSVANLADEIIIVDNFSTDKTIEISRKYTDKIYLDNSSDLGRLKRRALKLAKGDWILNLDADEELGEKLRQEIKTVVKAEKENQLTAFYLRYRNHFLSQPLRYGGEDYKMIRLFKKRAVRISDNLVHESFVLRNKRKVGVLDGYINHFSYRSCWQILTKFTEYGLREAEKKYRNREKVTLSKLFLYPPHMVYARFIKSEGCRDGLWRLPLDMGFGYMEFLAYWGLLAKKIMSHKILSSRFNKI